MFGFDNGQYCDLAVTQIYEETGEFGAVYSFGTMATGTGFEDIQCRYIDILCSQNTTSEEDSIRSDSPEKCVNTTGSK